MNPIPISAAKRLANEYGYDQVIVYARKVGESPDPHGEHMTTYGVNTEHCDVAARIGDFLKYEIMGWDMGGSPADRVLSELMDRRLLNDVDDDLWPEIAKAVIKAVRG
ncbi:hypothetical protein [Afipia felis]|uniref:Uncharacterized protein n=2 Tax=Afipia felis TaxID=1035 RepID=A0A380WAN1_AFIFE|nr:hypothetical protein [Afipia felis]EKS29277.1 hypothetical protein HMPREF9697_01805 [Afipia felis ATCC 53690]SUU77985.1 Uncharacterised protein [Afipia felis]SUU86050.1 Uncharacterised protein [Afipia felis]